MELGANIFYEKLIKFVILMFLFRTDRYTQYVCSYVANCATKIIVILAVAVSLPYLNLCKP